MKEQLGGGSKFAPFLLPSQPSASGDPKQKTLHAGVSIGGSKGRALPVLAPLCGKLIRTSLREHEEGGSMVEFAMVFPILMLIVTAIFTFGIAFNNYIELTDAVGIAGRQLAISSLQTLDPCSTASTAVYKAAPLLSKSNLTFSFTLNGTPYSGATCASASQSVGAASNLQSGDDATITVTYPCNLTIWGNNYAPSCTLQATTTEKVQ
jgi:Flp pilus assembly protein TadG